MRTVQWMGMAGLATACALAGCSSDATTATSLNAAADANLQVVFDDVSALSSASGSATGNHTDVLVLPSMCVFGSAAQTFTCPERVQHVGNDVFHIESAFSLLDVNGATQSTYGLTTTDGVRLIVTQHDTIAVPASGSFPGGSYTVTRNDDRTVTGLLSATRILNGVGKSTSSLLGISEYDTTRAVALPRRGSTDVLPTSGTIVVTGGSSDLGFAAHTTLTFVGGNTFTLTNSTGATETCTMDGVTRKVTCN
jgi:hypothetical protein